MEHEKSLSEKIREQEEEKKRIRDQDDARKKLEEDKRQTLVEPKPKETPEQQPYTPEQQAMLQEANEILKTHGNLEANIPLTNRYWDLMNQFRTSVNDAAHGITA
jgi:hypothetical protein